MFIGRLIERFQTTDIMLPKLKKSGIFKNALNKYRRSIILKLWSVQKHNPNSYYVVVLETPVLVICQ